MKKKRKQTKKWGKIARLLASDEGARSLADPRPEWRRYYKVRKKSVTLRLDADVLAWFKEQGPGYQTRINRTLRKAMAEGKTAD
jgi:uncharacterized protein (DUF4415 family)